MYAERLILETDDAGKLKQIPVLPANKKLEVIFMVIAETDPINPRRQPHQDIAVKTKIMGNIMDTASAPHMSLAELAGGLEDSIAFAGTPANTQQNFKLQTPCV